MRKKGCFIFYFYIRREQNDIIKWIPTKLVPAIIFCQMLINIIKKGKNYKKIGGHKPNQVKPRKSVSRPQTSDTKIKTTQKCINLIKGL